MGCEGGSIPSRQDIVKTANKNAPSSQLNQNYLRHARLHFCQLSGDPLDPSNVIVTRDGRLFNKEAVLEAVLSRSFPLKRREWREVKACRNRLYDPEDTSVKSQQACGDGTEARPAPIVCPVTGREMNGSAGFVVNWTCGCLLSEEAVKLLGGRCACEGDTKDLIKICM
jgi:hypothetical protein